jgi:ribose transport system substrate-binding protein
MYAGFAENRFKEVRVRMKKICALLMVAVALASLSGAAFAAERQFVIGATIFDMSIPFYANFIKGLNDGAAENGFKMLLRDGQGDPNAQIAVIQQFIAEKVDLIVIVPGDAQAVVPGIVQANAAKIPVISANNKVGEGASIVTFVGADDYYFGKQQGKLLVEAIGERGSVGYLMGKLGTSAQVLRRDGLMDFLKDYPDIKIVSEISEGWDSAEALASAQDMLSRHPKGSLDAILCQGPEAVPAARFAVGAGREEVKWILGDYPQDVREAIREGIIYGTVDQDPYPQAVEALKMAKLFLTGEASKIPTPNYFLELPLVTKKNVEELNAAW